MKKSIFRKDFKLSFDKTKIEFLVNEKKRTVTCTLKAELLSPVGYLYWIGVPNTDIKAVGIARCHEEDNFDIERGKRIAMAKAENKAYQKCVLYLERYAKEMLEEMSYIGDFCQKVDEYCAHNEDYIESVSSPEHQFYKKELKEVSCGTTHTI